MKTTYNYATHKKEAWYSEEEIKPFLDPYFKGLDFKTIAELAKKSIRITAYNRELEEKIEAYKLENQEAKEIIAELEWKCKELEKRYYDR